MADRLSAYVPTREHPGVTDVPRRGSNLPVVEDGDESRDCVQYTGAAGDVPRACHRNLKEHKLAVLATLARDAAGAEAVAAKQAALRASLHRLLGGLDMVTAGYIESRIRGACHDGRDFENVIGVLRELGFPR